MRKILFIAATHGNERDGVKVMRQLEKELPKEKYGYDWIIGNEKAFLANTRFTNKILIAALQAISIAPYMRSAAQQS